jgi:hypothetical protein
VLLSGQLPSAPPPPHAAKTVRKSAESKGLAAVERNAQIFGVGRFWLGMGYVIQGMLRLLVSRRGACFAMQSTHPRNKDYLIQHNKRQAL